ncbi:nucleolar protein,Nop52-domain-containing protein [Neocallimastix lanati (nom. inval.)]|jgi:ribosomal RNA-processing protein 1|nr:nucleolar protein,Nop52-domain-containing protein [Neocallimastix sp. JGI-2020a]
MAQQNSFGKALASADKKVRDKAVKRLSKYLSNKKDLSDLDLLKLWKGLFYCFWMSDKPLVQQQLSEKLASLILKIPDEIAIKFIETFWKEIRLEWTGIDRLRLDKFYYLFRQIHLNSFKFLEKVNWDITHVIKYLDIFTDGPLSLLDQTVPPSLLYHACEVFIPELEKAISKPIPSSVFIEILEPFFDVIGFCSNDILVEKVVEELFLNIVNIYENEEANEEEEESNVVKSCNFKDIYERLEKLNNEPLVLKKNFENIESLIIVFKGLSEAQGVLQDEEGNEKNEEDDDENKEVEEEKTKTKSKGMATKKAVKKTTKKNTKKEQPIEINEDEKPVKKNNKKRKAEVESIEIDDENKEDEVEFIESPKKKRKTPARAAKKEAKSKINTKSTETHDKAKEEIIVINGSDEEKEKKKTEPKKVRKSKRLNQKKKTVQ